MTQTNAEQDLDKIAHLDFEPDGSGACEGYVLNSKNSAESIDTRPCSNTPKIMGVRVCCGRMTVLCLRCYNIMIEGRTDGIKIYGCVRHSRCGSTVKTINPFSQVHFL